MKDQQEFNTITNKPFVAENIWDPGNFYPTGSIVNYGDTYYQAQSNVPADTAITNATFWQEYTPSTISDVQGTRQKDYEINDAILAQADAEVPLSGWSTLILANTLCPRANGADTLFWLDYGWWCFVLVIFSEPHAYISPTLYQSYPNVPTWNYVAVHAYGQVKILDDEQTLQLMEQTVAHFEPQKEKFWDNLPPNYRKNLLDELVAFKFYVTRVEATKKISQNKSQIDQNNIIANLEKSEDENARKIAEIMRNK
jgi:hypothetical protein